MAFFKKYTNRKLNHASLKLIELANGIIEDMAAQGYTLTLRQLYYQFVSRNLIANTEKEGRINAMRKMLLKDILIKLLSFIDDPLNPGFPPTLSLDGNIDGTDDVNVGFDAISFITNIFVIKQRSIMEAIRDLAAQNNAVVYAVPNATLTGTVIYFEAYQVISTPPLHL